MFRGAAQDIGRLQQTLCTIWVAKTTERDEGNVAHSDVALLPQITKNGFNMLQPTGPSVSRSSEVANIRIDLISFTGS